MLAVRLEGWQREPVLRDVPMPEPGPGEVLVKVDAAGLCHSDVHMIEAPPGVFPVDLPFTLGHETAGTVAGLGAGATGVAEGQRVLVYSRWGCGACWQCVQGRENLCERSIQELGGYGGGIGRDGGLAEYVLVPSTRYLVGIDGLDPVAAAPLSDAALTPYHAIQRSPHQLRPNGAAVVIGVGGIGHMAVQLLRALSEVRVVAVDVREDGAGARARGRRARRGAGRRAHRRGAARGGRRRRARRSCSTASRPTRRCASRRASSGRAATSSTWGAAAAG